MYQKADIEDKSKKSITHEEKGWRSNNTRTRKQFFKNFSIKKQKCINPSMQQFHFKESILQK